MKNLIVLAFLIFPAGMAAYGSGVDEAAGFNAPLLSDSDYDLGVESFAGKIFALNDPEYFPRAAEEKPKASNASRKSQSRRHSSQRIQSYRAPNTNSIRAGQLGGSRGTPTPSSLSQTRGGGKPPLRMSRRDRFFGVGSREFGFNLGASHSFTDLQNSKGLPFTESLRFQANNPGFSFGLYSKLRMVEWFGLSLGVDYGRISGKHDGTLSDFEGYSFENNLVEFNARIAFYAPLASMNVFDVYAFAGLALFNQDLSMYDAQGLPFEPGEEHSTLQPAIPFGIGLSWLLGTRIVLGYELGYRYSAFNYLDGISPVDTRYDAYLFNSLKIGFILKPRGK